MTLRKHKLKKKNDINKNPATGDDITSKSLKDLCLLNLPVSPTSKQPCSPELLYQNHNRCQL